MTKLNERLGRHYLQLREKWEEETAHLSSLGAANPHYQEILDMGPDAIPLILEDLQKHPGWIVTALYLLTDEQPNPEPQPGSLDSMINAWITWGKEKSLIE